MTVPTVLSPDVRQIWRTARGPAAVALLIILVAIATALVQGSGEGGSMDPRSVTPSGSRALARLLETQGVRIDLVRTAADTSAKLAANGPATLLVTQPDWLGDQQLDALGRQADELVLIAAGQDTVDTLALPVHAAGEQAVTSRAPGCPLEAATAAGVASMGGVHYRASPVSDPAVQLCYSGSLARITTRDRTITVLGTDAPLVNARLAEEGNAALAMRLLGQHERLIWYVPSLGDPSLRAGQRPLSSLLPDGWRFGIVQTAVAVALLALWRARRLGPVVGEPLPVVVRAAETVEGTARLYRRAHAVDHAAAALRQASRDRLVARLALPADSDPDALVTAVASRTGRATTQLSTVLYGPPPTSGADLVRLADALDALESEVTRP
jgi:hypothetical protein